MGDTTTSIESGTNPGRGRGRNGKSSDFDFSSDDQRGLAPASSQPTPVSVVGRRDARETASVVVLYSDGSERELEMARDAGGHVESDGFEWGYSGQGPYALAVSLLALVAGVTFDATSKSPTSTHDLVRAAGLDVRAFVRIVVSELPRDGWTKRIPHLARIASLHSRGPVPSFGFGSVRGAA